MTAMTPARVLAVFDQLALEASLFRKERKTECAEFASESASARTAVAALIAERDALAKRVAELEADAGRYQFLRDAEKCRTLSAGRTGLILGNFGEDLDSAIDAARAEARNG